MPRTYVKKSTGQRYVSVTTVTGVMDKPALLYFYGKHGTEEANRIKKQAGLDGTQAHDLVERFLKGEPIDSKDARTEGIWAAANRALAWTEQVRYRPLYLETAMNDDELGVAGRTDTLGIVRDRLAIVDWKFGKHIYDEAPIQLSAYVEMILRRLRRDGGKDFVDAKILEMLDAQSWTIDRYIVHSSNETGEFEAPLYPWFGDATNPQHSHKACWEAFLHCLSIYRWKQKNMKRFIEPTDIQFLEETP